MHTPARDAEVRTGALPIQEQPGWVAQPVAPAQPVSSTWLAGLAGQLRQGTRAALVRPGVIAPGTHSLHPYLHYKRRDGLKRATLSPLLAHGRPLTGNINPFFLNLFFLECRELITICFVTEIAGSAERTTRITTCRQSAALIEDHTHLQYLRNSALSCQTQHHHQRLHTLPILVQATTPCRPLPTTAAPSTSTPSSRTAVTSQSSATPQATSSTRPTSRQLHNRLLQLRHCREPINWPKRRLATTSKNPRPQTRPTSFHAMSTALHAGRLRPQQSNGQASSPSLPSVGARRA